MSLAEETLAKTLAVAFRLDFPERDATARQLSELLLDGVSAALPLTRHEPSASALAELEGLAQQTDVYAWDGAPGWDVVLERGLLPWPPLPPGPPILDGIGARSDRSQQRGELKRRAHAGAEQLIAASREATRSGAPGAVVAAHAALLRLVGLASASSLVLMPEDPDAGALPAARTAELLREMDQRSEGFAFAQEEWLAVLLAQNPAAAQEPKFRTFYAGISQSLRVAPALRRFEEEAKAGRLAGQPEALLGALGTWQPVRWPSLRAGAPSAWIEALCPAPPEGERNLDRLQRECNAGLDVFARLWFATGVSLTGFAALAGVFTARCAGIVALWEELGGGGAAP
jgi:hypothetical protein